MTPRAKLDRPAAPPEPFVPCCPVCKDRGVPEGWPLYSSLGELAGLLADNRIVLCGCAAGERAKALVQGLDGSVLVRMPNQKVSLCKVSELVKLEGVKGNG